MTFITIPNPESDEAINATGRAKIRAAETDDPQYVWFDALHGWISGDVNDWNDAPAPIENLRAVVFPSGEAEFYVPA